jgi:plasmid maintenance system killer protein
MASRLRRREAVLRETPPAPPSQGGATSQRAARGDHKELRAMYFTLNELWCLTFGWDAENAVEVDLENYH